MLKVKQAINQRRLKLSLERETRLIALVYEHCRNDLEKPDHQLVEKYLLLAD